MNLKMHLVSSLVKVFPDEEPRAFDGRVEGFLNENVSFQAAWIAQDPSFTKSLVRIRVESPIAAYVRVRRGEAVRASHLQVREVRARSLQILPCDVTVSSATPIANLTSLVPV